MEDMDLEVLQQCAAWLAHKRQVMLFTVARTWGSSPRPVGSLLAIRDDGLLVGSVSGGCVEDDLIVRIRQGDLDLAGLPRTLQYGVTADEAHRFGLPCGGNLILVAEALGAHSGIDELLDRIRSGHTVARSLSLSDGSVELMPDFAEGGVLFDDRRLVAGFGPRWRILVIGAGQLSGYFARMAGALGYRITVCEPREEYRKVWKPVAGVEVVASMPDDTVVSMRPDPRTAVVALTHDPKLDDLALLEALATSAFYVGAIGSRRNSDARRERLSRYFGVADTDLARLHAPIGLYIGSRTPPEIAVSILAEITAKKNGVEASHPVDVATGKAMDARHVDAGILAGRCGLG